ncbi:MAG: efflux RND transporter periplasmic adaptor subunit, partial [Prolixibacteraceae bacterium]|nr:efflux RND transporter periplasmic adaptor subunit [Prolixibacteraceae bacterium]
VSAKTSGIVKFTNGNILPGKSVSAGQGLFIISGDEMADNNSSTRFAEAKNNYEKAKADFDRTTELAKDRIVSEKDLLDSKNKYENARAVYTNLNTNFSSKGQTVKSPMSGFVKQLFVANGQFAEAGQPLISVTQNRTLLLQADVQQKYASVLSSVNSAIIRLPNENQTYTLEELNGKILSFGRNTNSNNFLIPVSIQVSNTGSFTAGSFVEVYLKTLTNASALTIPNSAIMEEQGNFFVFVQVNPELFEKREIKPGATDGLRTEIKSGIVSSDRIVSKGAILVKLAQSSGALDAHSGHVH